MSSKTLNQHLVKKRNKTFVLEIIKKRSPISRAKIAEITKLNKGTVSSLVNELIEENLVAETGLGKSSGGRRPVMLLFNASAGYSIGIDIGVNYIFGVLTDLNGKIIKEKQRQLSEHNFYEVYELVTDLIRSLKSFMKASPYGLIGVGIGVPGIVHNNGDILLAPNLNWRDIPLKEMIEKEFNVPTFIENEANAGAYGEKIYGIGKGHKNITYISAGIGIGVGLIIDDKLYRGNNGFSGEMGHMTIQLNGKTCQCGKRGCWELYASEKAIIEKAVELGIENGNLNLEKLIKLAEENDPIAIQTFEVIGEFLGLGISNIINTFNPEQIIIGNRIAKADKWLIESLEKQIKNDLFSFYHRDLSIHFSSLNTYSTALGMCAFSIERFLEINLSTEAK